MEVLSVRGIWLVGLMSGFRCRQVPAAGLPCKWRHPQKGRRYPIRICRLSFQVSELSAAGLPGGGALKAAAHRPGSLGRLRRHFTPDRSKQVGPGFRVVLACRSVLEEVFS